MEDVMAAILWQIAGYLIASGFAFVLFGFWLRGYFFQYLRVRTSLGKLVLVKLIGPTKTQYKIGKVEEGNLIWGKPGKDGHILNDIKRDYIYKEQNVDCVDVDSITYAFMPKEAHYAKKIKPIKESEDMDQYAKIFKKDGNEVVICAIEGFDPEKVDSLIQRAQFKPSQFNKTMQFILAVAMITLLVSAAGAIGSFLAGDKVTKADTRIGEVGSKADKIIKYIEQPKVNGSVVPTGRSP